MNFIKVGHVLVGGANYAPFNAESSSAHGSAFSLFRALFIRFELQLGIVIGYQLFYQYTEKKS